MAEVRATAVAAAGRATEMVFAGHVHNYQRFTVTDTAGVMPFIVAGFGGYHNPHKMVMVVRADLVTPCSAPNHPAVVLERSMADRFDLLRLEISRDTIELRAMTVPRPQEPWRTPPRLFDRMRLDGRNRRLL